MDSREWSRSNRRLVLAEVKLAVRDPLLSGLRALVLIGSLLTIAVAAQVVPPAADSAVPSRQIDLAKLGYQGLSAEGRMMTTANVTLNFVDGSHVLLTFNPKKLFQRDPKCPPSHKDR